MSISEILGTIHDGHVQVCATAEASYDGATERIAIALRAFTRCPSASADGAHGPEPWLPADECVTEHLPRSQSDEFVKDVFQSWVKKVRTSVPHDLVLRS